MFAAVASSAGAQGRPRQPDKEQLQARYQIFVMEGVLERAVQHGAQILSREMQDVMPDMVLLSGAARARGFRLDGYGVFFDVDVPALRRSVAWSFRVLDQNDLGLTSALQSLKRHVQSLSDERSREDLEQALMRVELQVGPISPPSGPAPDLASPGETASLASTTGPVPPEAGGGQNVTRAHLLADPGDAYTREVKDALIDAMLDHSGSIAIGDAEWLTIAARDNEDRRLAPGDPYEVSTIVLRIRGTDLAAFRASKLTREEARQAVEVREF
jgi:hypothetical protein